MNSKFIGKIFLLYTIATKFTRSNSVTNNNLKQLFTFDTYQTNHKEITLNDEDLTAVVKSQPTGLQRTVLDLDFPEGSDNHRGPRYRIIQCLAIGKVDYLQRKIYKKVSLKITPRDPYDDFKDDSKDCTNTLILTISPPGSISSTDNVLTNVYKLFEKKITINKKEPQTVVFEDVLDSDFIDMDLFWVHFEITGKCSKYLVIELLKPQNADLYGDKEGQQRSNQEAQTQAGTSQARS